MSRPGEIISCPEEVNSPLGIDGVQLYPPGEDGPTGWLVDTSSRILIETRGTKGKNSNIK